MVPLRLLSLREKEPERWKLAMNLVSHFDDHEAHNNDKVEYILATSMPILENCGVSKEDIRLIAHLMGILWYVITFLVSTTTLSTETKTAKLFFLYFTKK